MSDPVCILIRNKPCKVDAFEIAMRNSCAFVGYAAFRAKPGDTKTSKALDIVPFNVPDSEWKRPDVIKGSDTQKNRNIVTDLAPNRSFLIMPRMREGVLYVGLFEHFEFLDSPPWLDEFRVAVEAHFKKERDRPKGRDRDSSVSQILKVTKWKPISYSLFPAWLRKCVTGRGGVQRIGNVADFSAYDELRALYEGRCPPPLTPTSDLEEIERRLLAFIGPEAFEHLMVYLLQLEQPEFQWVHVGGAGDGGVDGLCFKDGAPHAILQCKWQYNGKPVEAELKSRSKKLYVAALVGNRTTPQPEHFAFIGIQEVAQLLLKHAHRVPVAISMNIQNERRG